MYSDKRDFRVQDAGLCRQFLVDKEGASAGRSHKEYRNPLPNLRFIRINGLPDFWKEQTPEAYNHVFEQIPGTLVRQDSNFAFLICGTSTGIHIYMGANLSDCTTLSSALRGFLPGVRLGEPCSISNIAPACSLGGILIGQPTELETQSGIVPLPLPVDNICRGMAGSPFTVMVLASRRSNIETIRFRKRAIELMRQMSVYRRSDQELIQQARGSQENYEVQEYIAHLQITADVLQEGISSGLWQTSVYYAANDPPTALRLQGILKGSYNVRPQTVCQPVICLNMYDIRDYICPECALMLDSVDYENASPIGFEDAETNRVYFYNDRLFQTTLSGKQLSLLCRLPQHEYPGFFIDSYVEFDTCNRVDSDDKQWVRIGTVTQPGQGQEGFENNPYTLEINDFTRHLLVIGITGGGKSNTSKSLLQTLWGQYHKPFLVIESAKREYHELMKLDPPDVQGNFSELCVFTMGDDNVLPYRINPFECIPGVGLQTHIDYVLSSFNAAFDMAPPMPYVLESSVFEIYEDRGWDVTTGQNRYGRTDFPTLTDLYYKIDEVVNRMGYYIEVQNNVKAALKARVGSLRIGGKGLMLDTPRSIPIGELLNKPVVLELEDLADDDTKAFVIGVLMVQLYEYRKGQSLLAAERGIGGDVPASSKSFQHLLVIEEAHRLLKRVEPGSSPTRAKSVDFFCNMLAEIRSYGQGLMICDQVPTKLAPDVLKNTNLKLIHRTVMEEDRRAVGAAMNMTEPQMEYLSSLRRGCAAAFAEGDNRPKLVMMPLVKDKSQMGRRQIIEKCRQNIGNSFADVYKNYTVYPMCRFCQHQCECRQSVEDLLKQNSADGYLNRRKQQAEQTKCQLAKAFSVNYLLQVINTLCSKTERTLSAAEQMCLAGALIDRMPLEIADKTALTVAYQKIWSNIYCK